MDGKMLAAQTRRLLAEIRGHRDPPPDPDTAALMATWARLHSRFGCEANRKRYAPDPRCRSVVDSAGRFVPHARLIAALEAHERDHEIWSEGERVEVLPTVGWRRDAEWQGA